MCCVGQRPVTKSISHFITVLSSMCSHYRCAASLILTTTVPEVTRVTIGIGHKFNTLVLLFYERPLHWDPKYLVLSKLSAFNVNVSPGISFTFSKIKNAWLHRSCNDRLLCDEALLAETT